MELGGSFEGELHQGWFKPVKKLLQWNSGVSPACPMPWNCHELEKSAPRAFLNCLGPVRGAVDGWDCWKCHLWKLAGIPSHRALQSLLCNPDNPHHPCWAGTTCRVELKNIWGCRNTVWWFLNYFKIVNKSRGGVTAAVCEGREMKQAWGKLAPLMVFVLKFVAFFHGFSAP